ncbi:hypothetical protein EI94DRAFT_1749567 [Lactarius quietus]|nr:hypothetical protein EI94DRAFT_1749567 [Lactarius quietus]
MPPTPFPHCPQGRLLQPITVRCNAFTGRSSSDSTPPHDGVQWHARGTPRTPADLCTHTAAWWQGNSSSALGVSAQTPAISRLRKDANVTAHVGVCRGVASVSEDGSCVQTHAMLSQAVRGHEGRPSRLRKDTKDTVRVGVCGDACGGGVSANEGLCAWTHATLSRAASPFC